MNESALIFVPLQLIDTTCIVYLCRVDIFFNAKLYIVS